MSKDELLTKMYSEIKIIKKEIEEIKNILIPEDEPTNEELEEIKLGIAEIKGKNYRDWKDIKKEI